MARISSGKKQTFKISVFWGKWSSLSWNFSLIFFLGTICTENICCFLILLIRGIIIISKILKVNISDRNTNQRKKYIFSIFSKLMYIVPRIAPKIFLPISKTKDYVYEFLKSQIKDLNIFIYLDSIIAEQQNLVHQKEENILIRKSIFKIFFKVIMKFLFFT